VAVRSHRGLAAYFRASSFEGPLSFFRLDQKGGKGRRRVGRISDLSVLFWCSPRFILAPPFILDDFYDIRTSFFLANQEFLSSFFSTALSQLILSQQIFCTFLISQENLHLSQQQPRTQTSSVRSQNK
jgi:hypothetical protein